MSEKKQLALMGAPFSPEQIETLRQMAAERGFDLLALERYGEYPADILANCQVLCGYIQPALLKNAKKLEWLQLPCAGADQFVDEAMYPHPGVVLTNASGAFGAAIAEQLVMGALMLLRRMPEYQRQQRAHVWNKLEGLRLLGNASVTVLGTGNLGGTFAGYCKALGACVTGVSRSGAPAEGFHRVLPMADLLTAVSGADVVAACLPLTGETRGVIDKDVFAAMGPETIFLNVGRGKTVAEADLIAALANGRLGGAMLDVFQEEPLPADSPLWDMENVLLTPHVSGSDQDEVNIRVIYDIFTDNLRRYFAGEPLRNVVDRRKGY